MGNEWTIDDNNDCSAIRDGLDNETDPGAIVQLVDQALAGAGDRASTLNAIKAKAQELHGIAIGMFNRHNG